MKKLSAQVLFAWLVRGGRRFLRLSSGKEFYSNNTIPEFSEDFNEKGKKCFFQGDLLGALNCFDVALSIKPDWAEVFSNRGAALKGLKRFSEAIDSFNIALSINPDDTYAFYNKGLTLLELNSPADALDCFDAALTATPFWAEAHNGRGIALKELGRLEDSMKCFDAALAISPNWAEVLCNRGQLLQELKRLEEALESYNAALVVDPERYEAYAKRGVLLFNLRRHEEALTDFNAALAINKNLFDIHGFKGLVLLQQNKTEQALESFESALEVESDCADVHFHRGVAFLSLQRYEDALASFNLALSLIPDWAEAHYNRGVAFNELMRKEEALACFDLALSINHDFPDAHNSRGVLLNDLERQEDALASYNAALSIAPQHAEALNNRGVVGSDLIGPDFALENFNAALAIKPDYIDAKFNKSLILIQTGFYPEGWMLYESRWKRANVKKQFDFRDPSWLGQENIVGKTLLIYPEQGFGDYIQFCRYALILKDIGVNVLFEVPKALVSVISTLNGDFAIVEKGGDLPSFDFQCPVMSLPLALGTEIEKIPAPIPYLFADKILVEKWRKKLGSTEKLRVGLVWSGSATHKKDYARSIPLEFFGRILELPLEFHSLQKEIRPHDEVVLPRFSQVRCHAEELGDFSDTAALIAMMDLVISVDTSVAHLACAMGKEVWILLPHAPDFRWMLERGDSPWYPTATLIRQPKNGDWNSVLLEVERKLSAKFFSDCLS